MCFGMRMSQKPRLVNELGELRENQSQADYGKIDELIHPDITGYLIILLRINSNRATYVTIVITVY